jgi:hypothetical protein
MVSLLLVKYPSFIIFIPGKRRTEDGGRKAEDRRRKNYGKEKGNGAGMPDAPSGRY